ncbi:MAG: hypothetical protein Q9204_003234 [Flavoplaca sp. TL-2023a]
MATEESLFIVRPNDGGLPEVAQFHGLEHHIPPSEQKQVHVHEYEEKEYNTPWHLNHPASPDAHGSHPSGPIEPLKQRERMWWKRQRFWIPLALLLLIGAIVAGVVGGLSARNDSSDKEASNTSPDSEAATSPSLPAQTSPKPLNSSLASVAWSEQRGIGYRRLYYQDDAGTVKESAWNSSGNEWYASNNNLGKAKANSPIAAAVAGDLVWPFVSIPLRFREHCNMQINIFYIHPDGHVIELYTKDGQDWESGTMTNEGIIPAPNSDLATIWSQSDQTACNECGQQTLVTVYQDSNDKLWVINATGPSPQPMALGADTVSGTGLAFQSVWHSEGSPGIRIYYQNGADDLMTIDYEDSEYGAQATGNTAWEWTLHEDSPIGPLADGASIASFSTGEDTATGDPLFQYTVSSTSQGINVAWLGGGEYSGTGWHTETPEVMRNVQPYSAVAANADRHVYAIEDGIVKDFVVSIDGTTWSLVGDVPTVT